VIRIHVPPLRERRDDIPLLAKHFLSHYCGKYGKREMLLSADALDAMTAHEWRGNIRELRNLMERCALLATGPEVHRSGLLSVWKGSGSPEGGEAGPARLPGTAGSQGGGPGARASVDPDRPGADGGKPAQGGRTSRDQPPDASVQGEGVRNRGRIMSHKYASLDTTWIYLDTSYAWAILFSRRMSFGVEPGRCRRSRIPWVARKKKK
jgi:DNA-binding NtrC family response regulator